jgi:hypothetical protein
MKFRTLGLWLIALILLATVGYRMSDRPEPHALPLVRYDGVVHPAVPVADKTVSAPTTQLAGTGTVQSEKAAVPISLDGTVVFSPLSKSPLGSLPATKAGQAAATKRSTYETAADVSDERLALAATIAKMDFAEFKNQARQDRDLKIDAMNQPFYLCEAMKNSPGDIPSEKAGSADDSKSPPAAGASFIATDPPPSTFTGPTFPVNATTAFQLHSRPGASRVIYLDFTGHTTLATSRWAAAYTGRTSFYSPPFQFIGTSSPTSQVNLDAIRDVWYRVSEDYAAWDVDVTTEQPPIDARGQRCVISGNWDDWIHVPCGGVSYLSTFGGLLNGADEPNFVFVDGAGNSVNGLQVCVSHEVGHAVGLLHMGEVAHDLVAAKGYSSGHAVGDYAGVTSCGPIMGSCYRVSLVQWSRGEYPYANNSQDEIATINTFIAPRTSTLDDHGDALVTATVVSGNSLSSGGILSVYGDVDLFKVNAGAGPLTVSAIGSRAYPNAKICLQLLNATGSVVASNYSLFTMSSTLNYSVPVRGIYYLKVIGVGYDTTTPVYSGTGIAQTVVGSSSGWTNYGSMGRYTISGSWRAASYPPVAVINSNRTGGIRPVTIAFDGTSSSDPDGIVVSGTWNFGDPASGSANVSTLSRPSHTYGAVGTYTARLIVVDDQGNASAEAQKIITVTGTAAANAVNVASMTGSWVRMTNVEVAGTALIQIVNQYGQPMRSTAVYVRVSGSASGSSAAKSDLNGFVTIQMPKQRMTNPSNYTFTVTKLVYPAYVYNAAANIPMAASVTISR